MCTEEHPVRLKHKRAFRDGDGGVQRTPDITHHRFKSCLRVKVESVFKKSQN